MGQEQSQQRHKYSSEMYVPVSQQASVDDEDAEKNTIDVKQRKIANHGIAAIWSMHISEGASAPGCRSDFFYVTDKATKRLFIGFGVLNDGTLTNELCILDLETLEWQIQPIEGERIKPRSGCRATIFGNKILIFGGKDEFNFLNDLIIIDTDTLTATTIETTGDVPSGRINCVIGIYQTKLVVWGGYDGSSPNSLYVLDLRTRTWHSKAQDITGRNAAAFVQDEQFIYVCGASKTGGLIIIDMEKETIAHYETEGAEPLSTMTNAGLIKASEYLVFIGGKSSSNWSTVNALDIPNKTWFIVHIKPDEKTVSEADGNVTETGVFMIPRTHSMAVAFDDETRKLYTCLGSPMFDPAPVYTLELGEAIGVMHLRDDLLTSFHKMEKGDVIDD